MADKYIDNTIDNKMNVHHNIVINKISNEISNEISKDDYKFIASKVKSYNDDYHHISIIKKKYVYKYPTQL